MALKPSDVRKTPNFKIEETLTACEKFIDDVLSREDVDLSRVVFKTSELPVKNVPAHSIGTVMRKRLLP